VADEEHGDGVLGHEHAHHAVILAIHLRRSDPVLEGRGERERQLFAVGRWHSVVYRFRTP
jgi:hypothetical protein